jgi:hypothetical protein
MSDLPKSGRSRAIFAGGSPGSRAGRCRAVIRLSRDPTRRTWRRADGPRDGDGGSVNASVMQFGMPMPDLMRGPRQPRNGPWTSLGCTHEIADSDLINVRFDPLCGPQSDIYRGPRSAKADSCTAANLPSLTVDRFLEHHVLMTSYSEMPSSFAFIRSTERRFGRNALSQI